MTLITYDIADTKRLQKISRLLGKYGLRAQNSTFELDISETDLKLIECKIEDIMDLNEDKVFIYRISNKKKNNKRKGKRKNMWELIF